MESTYFIFDGVKSIDMDLYIVRIGQSGFVETPYWGETTIHEEQSKKRLSPYFYGITRSPIEFTVQFFLADKNMQPKKWTPKERYKIAQWLLHDTYKEFQTGDDLGKRYYAICTSDTNINLINNEGYIQVTFRTNSPFAWSSPVIDRFDLSENVSTTIIELDNKSNILKYYNPMIEIELVDDETNIQLKNLSNDGKTMKFEDLIPNETISIDCENKIIKSDKISSSPFLKFNKDMKRYWLDLVYGINRIEITGKCKIKTKMQFPIAQ